jgi:hypothetical protein
MYVVHIYCWKINELNLFFSVILLQWNISWKKKYQVKNYVTQFLFKLWLPGISESFGLLSYSTAALHKSCEEPERESSLDLYFYSKFFRGKICSPPPP